MNTFIADDGYLDAVRNAIVNAQRIDVAVAFWGAGADDLFAGVTVSTRILCNLLSGGTNPAPLRTLLESPHIKLHHTADLHAKVFMTDTVAIVGSANFSTNGLHYEGHELDGWHEAGILTDEPNLVKQAGIWFKRQWAASSEITLDDLEKAQKLWKRSRAHRTTGPCKSFNELRKADLLDRPIYLVLWTEHASEEAQKEFNRAKKKDWKDAVLRIRGLSFYEGWDELPTDAYLIDAYIGPLRGITFGPVYKRVPRLDRDVPKAHTSIQIVASVRQPVDFPFHYDDAFKVALRNRLKENDGRDLPNDEEPNHCIPLADIFMD